MERITSHQFMLLSAAVLLGITFMGIGNLAAVAGRDAWLSALPGFIWTIPFGQMLLSMIPNYPGKNLIEISEEVLGKWVGKGMGIIYILIFTYIGGLRAAQEADLFSRSVLPLMPRFVFILGGIVIGLYLFNSGIEVLGRFSEVIFPIIAASLILIAVFVYPRFEEGSLFPILANGIKPILLSNVKIIHFSMGYIMFLAGLLPFLPKESKDLREMKKGLMIAVLIVILLNTLIVFIQIMTFGPSETARMTYGLLVLGRLVEVSQTIAGVESIFVIIWMGSSIIIISAAIFIVMWGIKSILGLKNWKWSLLLAGVFFLISRYFTRGMDLIVELTSVGQYLLAPFAVFWVLLVWGVDKWKRRQKSSG